MRALIVDDERLARKELRRLLQRHTQIDLVGEAADGAQALELISALDPDLIFLDIQMPGMDGFELLTHLDPVPEIIFTTAYDDHAIRAFEVNALDYLLKPLEEDRLAEALLRTGRTRRHGLSGTLTREHRFFIRDGDRCWFVQLAQVRLLESEGNYTRLYFGPNRPLVYRSLTHFEERLSPEQFFRVGRKHIVGLDWVRGLDPTPDGGLAVTVQDCPSVRMSRRKAKLFRQRMGL